MISERTIAEKFASVWKLSFPFLNSNFMRVFNEGQVGKFGYSTIDVGNNIRYDLISECAFNVVVESYNKFKIEDLVLNDKELDRIIKYTAKSIWLSGNYEISDLTLNEAEVEQIISLSNNLLKFIDSHPTINVNFRPCLKGFGFISDLEGDISIDNTLYEIKTVKRKFRTSDLKQLIVYLALQQVDDSKESWVYAGLYNPRTGAYCKFNVTSFVSSITGGKTPNEAFSDFLNSLVRDIQVDSKF